jgi:hypothetical protein
MGCKAMKNRRSDYFNEAEYLYTTYQYVSRRRGGAACMIDEFLCRYLGGSKEKGSVILVFDQA